MTSLATIGLLVLVALLEAKAEHLRGCQCARCESADTLLAMREEAFRGAVAMASAIKKTEDEVAVAIAPEVEAA